MKRTYLRPEYNTDSQLNDIILASVQVDYDEENKQIDVNLDIEDLF